MNSEKHITKSDLCWVLVKLAGLWLIYTAIATLYTSAVTWFSMSDVIDKIAGNLRGPIYAPMKLLLFGSFLPLAVGIYLLKSGTAVYHCLMSIPTGSRDAYRDDSIPGTSLTGDEKKEITAWLEKNPELADRDTIDQIALFRDAQRKRTGGEAPDCP